MVWLAGTFNRWQPWDTAMRPAGNGLWVKNLLLKAGRYEYCIVAEGTWLADPWAYGFVEKGFGQQAAVLVVEPIRPGGRRRYQRPALTQHSEQKL